MRDDFQDDFVRSLGYTPHGLGPRPSRSPSRGMAIFGGVIGTLIRVVGLIALQAWVLMLLLGALHSVTDWPVNQGGYWASVIMMTIAVLFVRSSRNS